MRSYSWQRALSARMPNGAAMERQRGEAGAGSPAQGDRKERRNGYHEGPDEEDEAVGEGESEDDEEYDYDDEDDEEDFDGEEFEECDDDEEDDDEDNDYDDYADDEEDDRGQGTNWQAVLVTS